MRFLDHRQTTDARTDIHADTFGILLGDFQPGILECFHSGHQTEMDESVHAARILGGKVLRDIKIFHFAGNLSCHRTGIKMSDIGNAGFPRDNVLTDRWNPYPDWGDDPQSGNDKSAFREIDSATQEGWTNRKRWVN